MIHCTVGVYPNGEHKSNGVDSENLAAHIAYNLRYRPGRAFFVDGICIHRGYLSREECDKWEVKLSKLTRGADTAPYV